VTEVKFEEFVRMVNFSHMSRPVYDRKLDQYRATVNDLVYAWPGRLIRNFWAHGGHRAINLLDDKYCVDPDARGLL
jgi:hypothetical protein